MAAEIKWLWKITPTEEFYDNFSLSYQLTLATRKPLLEDHVTRALSHLFRKVPSLRACYGRRNGELWIREMTREILDFQVIVNITIPEVHREMHSYRYNTETGPLWCIRLLAEPPSSPEVPPGLNISQFPYLYTIFLGIRHCITDGYSNMRICGFLIQLLDAVVEGKVIDNTEQLGVFISDEKTQKLLKEKVLSLKTEPELKQSILEEMQARQSEYSLIKATYKGAGHKLPKTEILERNADAKTTISFMRRCRSENVTVNSALTALASIAIVDLLHETGLEKDVYGIRSIHVLNARRYWEENASHYLGCHILPPMHIKLKLHSNVNENFWNFARSVHKDLTREINKATPLLEEATKRLVPETFDSYLTFEHEFALSNLGNVTALVTEGGNHVQGLHVIRTSSVHSAPCTWCLMVHTFRDRLILMLVYNTGIVSSQMAEKLCDRIFCRLHEVL